MNNTPIDVRTAFDLQQNGALIVDVREADEFEAGHVENAISIPLSELGARYQEIPKDEQVLIICKSGGRSGQACEALGQAQYNVTNISGGSLDWYGEKLPFVSENESDPTVL